MELDDAELLMARDELLGAQSGPPPSSSRIWRDSIVAAVGLAVAGMGCSWLVLSWIESKLSAMYPSSSPETGVWSYAGMATVVGGCVFVAGLVCWRRLAARGTMRSDGALAGALTALLSHFLVMAALCTIVALNSPPSGRVADLFVAGLVFSFLSLLFFGWVTIPVGALVGWVIADRQSRGRVSS